MAKKEKKEGEPDPSVLVRAAVEGLWEAENLRGRTWGIKHDGNNPFWGTHISLADPNNIVIIVGHRKTKQIRIIEAVIVDQDTPLGDKVRATIQQAGLSHLLKLKD